MTNAQLTRIFSGFERLSVRLDGLEIVARDTDCVLGKEMHGHCDAELVAITTALRATAAMLSVAYNASPPPPPTDGGIAEARALMRGCQEAARSLALLQMDEHTATLH